MNSIFFDAFKYALEEQEWSWQAGKTIPHGEQIVVTDGTSRATLNFYPKRGKMVVGGADTPLKAALTRMVEAKTAGKPDEPPASRKKSARQPIIADHIGMDESGKGDWFGPLVVAATYVDEHAAIELRDAGIRDSKTIEPAAMQRKAASIEDVISPEHRHVCVIAPEQYNGLYERYQNINLLLAEVYARVADTLWQQIPAEMIVCDQFSQRDDRLNQSFAAHKLPSPCQFSHAESVSIAVAAASILATATFLREMERLGHEAGLKRPLPRGASDIPLLQAAAQELIAQHGKAGLGRFARLHFAPVQALLQ
jgi:ribonuclease HIII